MEFLDASLQNSNKFFLSKKISIMRYQNKIKATVITSAQN